MLNGDQRFAAAGIRAAIRGLVLVGLTCAITQAAHPLVPGFERFHRAESQPSQAAGRLLVGELNCTSCHALDTQLAEAAFITAKQAPKLEQVGARVTPEFLRAFLIDPQAVKPGSSMPGMFHGIPERDRAEQVEDLVHFLASTGSLVPTPPVATSIRQGEVLFHSVGCVACHNSRRPGARQLSTSVPLGKPAEKYTIGSLSAFLRDPHAVRPSGRMPSLNLTEDEARDVANYLLEGVQVEPNVNFAAYHGNWESLPDFSTLKPVSEGGAAGFDLGVAGRTNQFAVRYTGFLHLAETGSHKFFLGSDDGSRLLIDGREVLNVDGIHPYSEKSATVELARGTHPIVVEFFQGGGEWILKVDYEPPGGSRQSLAGLVTATAEPHDEAAGAFRLDTARVERGREAFISIGCARCHSLPFPNNPLQAYRSTPALVQLDPSRGCLKPEPGREVPHFSLDEQQRAAIRKVVEDLKAPVERPDAADTIRHTMTSLNCFACHARHELGGVERARNDWFTGRIPEMGDEGRIPPLLDGVGDKLNAAWLQHVMDNGARDRPYMDTRMPRFARANTNGIVEHFAALDLKTDPVQIEFKEPEHRILAAARYMVGDQALSCIKCHNFAGQQGTGIQSVDLTTMSRRLRRDWFIKYMINPQAYRPGTRMPSAWPNGFSILPKVLEGDTDQQLAAIWRYLEDGDQAALPSGLGGQQIELVPKDAPLIYRNFIEGLSPRAIAVGYPEKAHLAFDATSMTPVWIWHRAFIDAAKHWVGRGPGNQKPLGDHVFSLGNHVPMAQLDSLEAAWPDQNPSEQGFRFLGYRLDEKLRPIFRYSWKGLTVEDAFVPVPRESDAGFVRTVTISGQGPSDAVWFRIASGKSLRPIEDNAFLLDEGVRLTVRGADPELRQAGGRFDLLVRVPQTARKQVIETSIDW